MAGVNTGVSRRIEAADFSLSTLREHERAAWATLSEAERERVLAWVAV
jgi:hypothetical protein